MTGRFPPDGDGAGDVGGPSVGDIVLMIGKYGSNSSVMHQHNYNITFLE